MKGAREVIKEDKRLIKLLVKEARNNDNKIMVYPYEKRITSKSGISFKREWHVMKEGNRTSKIFRTKKDAVVFAGKISKSSLGQVYISR